jgi:uncharacterized membrane protein YjjP (DUF1212 family)
VNAESPPTDIDALLDFMCRLGQAYLACGEQTALVESYLHDTAASAGVGRAQVVAFPTALFVGLYDGTRERVTLVEGPTQTLRLDQVADVYALGDEARCGAVPPRDGLERLAAILDKAPRFGPTAGIVGHTVLTVGLAMVLQAMPGDIAVAALLGAIVGTVKVVNRGRAVLALPLPVVAAALVSVLVFLAVKWGLEVGPRHVLIPPLVTFLPGAMLSLGMVELAYGDMVGGSSRLVTGFVKLVLLAFGLVVGAALVGYRPDDLVESAGQTAAPWLPWGGVVVFGVGTYLHFSAPRNSFLWMLLVLLLAFAAQQVATGLVGRESSGFFGTLVAMPLAYLIQKRFRGPPAMVTFLPSVWLLVPGSLGLLSVKRMLTDRAAGLEGLFTTMFAFASIGLGTLVGASLYKALTERVGQVGRYLRRRALK